eukprot:TRINITY_DN2631_c0_g1_i1.p1 TRINITY_DN2631_c0_g1~~TRINITY_DN2631_c0_g1_i1.p1  ORF type:complete len:103 (-),score=24.93 TRINITY_DN2631_c0_g1_i1:618-896(-)
MGDHMALRHFFRRSALPLLLQGARPKSQKATMFSTIVNLGKYMLQGSYAGESKYDPSMGSFYALSAKDIDGNNRELKEHEGKVSLVINVACM